MIGTDAPRIFLNPIFFSLLLNVTIEVLAKLKHTINRMKRAITVGEICIAG